MGKQIRNPVFLKQNSAWNLSSLVPYCDSFSIDKYTYYFDSNLFIKALIQFIKPECIKSNLPEHLVI